jgi:plasmid stability protein
MFGWLALLARSDREGALRLRGARHGRSMEAEIRVILTETVRHHRDHSE